MTNVIAFPALGLEFTINRVAFTIFGLNVYWYGVIIALGFLLAVGYANHRIGEFGFTSDQLYDALIAAIPSAIIGARLYYVAFRWSYYSQHLNELFSTREGGLAIYGGVIGALIAVSLYGRYKKLNIAAMFDVAALGLLIGQLVGRWANFINAEAHGGETAFFLGMTINGGAPVHPTFLYESIWNLIGFILIHILSKKNYRFRGQLFLNYLFWYGMGRFWIEGMRTDSLYIGSTGLRVSQLVSLGGVIVGGALLVLCFKRNVQTVQQLWNPNADPRPQRAAETAENQDK